MADRKQTNRKPGYRRMSWIAIALLALGLGCNLEATAPAATPEPIVVVVTATEEPQAAFSPSPTDEPPPTLTPTLEFTATLTDTPTITLTSTLSTPMATADKGVDVNCRMGPSPDYFAGSFILQGQTAQVYGRDKWTQWLQIQDPKAPANKCWVDIDFVSLSVPTDTLPEIADPGGYVYAIVLTLASTEVSIPGCLFPSAVVVNLTLKVSGPATVNYKVDNSSGWTTGTMTKTLTKFGDVTNAGGVPIAAAGDFWIKVTVTAPNSISQQKNGKAVCP